MMLQIKEKIETVFNEIQAYLSAKDHLIKGHSGSFSTEIFPLRSYLSISSNSIEICVVSVDITRRNEGGYTFKADICDSEGMILAEQESNFETNSQANRCIEHFCTFISSNICKITSLLG